MILEFPDEHPVLEDLPLDALPPAPAPVLMPGTPPRPAPPVSPKKDEPRSLKTTAGIMGAVAVAVAVILIVTISLTTQRTPPAASPSDVAAPGTTTSAGYT